MGAWEITRKDLRLLLRDRRTVILLLLLPLLFIAIVGMSTGQFLTAGTEDRRYEVGVVDVGRGEMSQLAVKRLEQHNELIIVRYDDEQTADRALRKNDIAAYLVFGPLYQERVDELKIRDMFGGDESALASGPEVIDLKLEVRSTVADGGLIRYFLYGEIYRSIMPTVARRNVLFRPHVPDDADEPYEEAPTVAETAPAAKADNPVYRFLVPGFTVMFVFFLINVMARSFIAERDLGTLRRLRLAPIPPVAVLVGKTLPFFFCSVLQTALLFFSGRLLFGMPWGPEPIYLIPVVLCTSAAATGLGLLLATSVKTDAQVSAYGTSLVLLLGGISGCFIPRAWLPDLMKSLSLATPHAWALKAFDAVLTPATVDSILVLDYCAALMGFAAVFYLAGWWRFRFAQT